MNTYPTVICNKSPNEIENRYQTLSQAFNPQSLVNVIAFCGITGQWFPKVMHVLWKLVSIFSIKGVRNLTQNYPIFIRNRNKLFKHSTKMKFLVRIYIEISYRIEFKLYMSFSWPSLSWQWWPSRWPNSSFPARLCWPVSAKLLWTATARSLTRDIATQPLTHTLLIAFPITLRGVHTGEDDRMADDYLGTEPTEWPIDRKRFTPLSITLITYFFKTIKISLKNLPLIINCFKIQ